jgi:hypothetical protein
MINKEGIVVLKGMVSSWDVALLNKVSDDEMLNVI